MRKHYSSALKAKIVTEALKETKTVQQLAAEYGIHPNQISQWKQAALDGLPSLFERANKDKEKDACHERKMAELYQRIGRLTTQVDWLKKKSGLQPDED